MSTAVRLVCFFSAAFAAMFMSRGSVTVPSSAKRPAERDSSQQHAAPRCDAGSTAWDRLVGLDRPDLRAVLGRLVQDQRHRGEGAEWQRVWARLALSEPPERLLDRPVRQADANPRYRALHRGSIAALSGLEGRQQHRLRETAAPLPRSAPSPSADDFHTATRGILEKIAHRHRIFENRKTLAQRIFKAPKNGQETSP